ncbi:MAG: Fis family transcriptional regulator [Methylophilaceae bacterium]|nr:Fis family transcriptional regulator [Methylophilaceae bacterium]
MKKYDLNTCIQVALDEYFKNLDGQQPNAVYDMVLQSVEKPLLEYIMKHANGNQSKAAEILGVNRNTLRKKLQQYQIQ